LTHGSRFGSRTIVLAWFARDLLIALAKFVAGRQLDDAAKACIRWWTRSIRCCCCTA